MYETHKLIIIIVRNSDFYTNYNSKKTKFSSYLDFNNSNPIYLSKTD